MYKYKVGTLVEVVLDGRLTKFLLARTDYHTYCLIGPNGNRATASMLIMERPYGLLYEDIYELLGCSDLVEVITGTNKNTFKSYFCYSEESAKKAIKNLPPAYWSYYQSKKENKSFIIHNAYDVNTISTTIPESLPSKNI